MNVRARIRLATARTVLFALAIAILCATSGSVAIASAATSPSPAPAAAGTKSGPGSAEANRATFGIKPATAGHADNRTEFSYRIGPLGSYRDLFEIDNYAQSAISLQVISVDLGNTDDGRISAGLASDHAVDVGAWISLPASAKRVNLPGATSAGPARIQVPFQVNVPAGASPGDHSGAILAVLSTLGKNNKGQNVRLDQRIASRVFVRVPGPLHPQLRLTNMHITYANPLSPLGRSPASVTYEIENSGNTRLGARSVIDVKGWFGIGAAGKNVADVQLLLPGQRAKVEVVVAGVRPAGRETATVRVTPLVLESDRQIPVASPHTSISFWAVPWISIAIVLLVLAVIAYLLIRRRGRPKLPPRSRHTGPNGPRHGPQPTGDPTPMLDRPLTAGR